jgi:hypothetical protein
LSKRRHARVNKYEIILGGHVDKKRFCGFEYISVQHKKDGTTAISGIIADQTMLFAIMSRIRDLGLKLRAVSVTEEHID